jgi:hypothetical protein
MIKITYLNHASLLFEIDELKLITDPWFSHTCFSEGWGLRYINKKAFEFAKNATHLWISHPHSDHLHYLTLKKILEINPNIIFLANKSYNFDISEIASRLGFHNILIINERQPIKLTPQITIERFPTTGIDNMLFIHSLYGTILNYNDCSLSSRAQKILKMKLGEIDIFLTNFNHAGKLLVTPPLDTEKIKERLRENFKSNFIEFNPKYVLPFASHHYYRAPESQEQNNAMLNVDDLVPIDCRVLRFDIGDTLQYIQGDQPFLQKGVGIELNKREQLVRNRNYQLEEIKVASTEYTKMMRANYSFILCLVPKLNIYISDLDINVTLNARKGLSAKSDVIPHISAHSSSLYNWFSQPFGTDNFVVGAHFEIVNNNKIPLKWQIIFGLLIDNKLSLKNVASMVFKKDGIKFLYNRREEIFGILTQFRINASYHD